MVELSQSGSDGLYALGYAGDTLNTAWYLRKRLSADWQVDYLTAIGTDVMSNRMMDFLRNAALGTNHVQRVPDRSVGLYMIELTNGERRFAYWRGQSAARTLAADPARLDAAFQGAGMIYLSGISLAILEGNGRPTFWMPLAAARSRGTMIAFDPNLRPVLWPDADSMRKCVMQVSALADIVLPSFEDEAEHFNDTNPMATADRYAAKGVPLVVVKNGKDAMLILNHGRIPFVHAHASRAGGGHDRSR